MLKTEGYMNSVFKNTNTALCALKAMLPRLLIAGELSTPFYITWCSTCTTHLPKRLNCTLHCSTWKLFCLSSCYPKTSPCFAVRNGIIHFSKFRDLGSVLVTTKPPQLCPHPRYQDGCLHFQVAITSWGLHSLLCTSTTPQWTRGQYFCHPAFVWV